MQAELSNNLRVSKNGLEERKIAEWVNVYEKERTEQKIGGIIMVLLFIIVILK